MGWPSPSEVGGGVTAGELSQQPTWAQVWHTRRWTQSWRPAARQSSQPVAWVSRCDLVEVGTGVGHGRTLQSGADLAEPLRLG